MPPRLGLISLSLLLVCAPANARLIENWPYERLFKEADLVVIVTAEGTTDAKDRFKPHEWKIELVGQDTSLAVHSVLKGKLDTKTLKVLHYRLPTMDTEIENGPMLVTFHSMGFSLSGTINGVSFKAGLPRPEYMVFLRTRSDGRFEPVSGQIDPALSVRELQMPDDLFRRRVGK